MHEHRRYLFIVKIMIAPLLLVWGCSGSVWAATEPDAPGRALAKQAIMEDQELWITADHSKFKQLKQPFTSGPEVTKACLGCHTEAALQFHKTIHWTWKDPSDDSGKTGKAGITLNNFCININSNEPRCTSCHAGYGWKDKNFDFTNSTRVDCLVCHEQTGTYKKFPTGAGNPTPAPKKFGKKMFYPPEWNKVAQSVARPSRTNCGVCHFYGGGGDGVKHGDLDSSLIKPNKKLDVHMGMDGQNFTCTRCHSTKLHNIAGRVYSTPAAKNRKSLLEDDLSAKIMCESCHSATPHKKGTKPNDHTDKVACQSCHIPAFARVNPTKMSWDWSTAGKKKDGKPYTVKGPYGKDTYNTKKGSFVWEKNVVPEYHWYNGAMRIRSVEETVDPLGVVRLTWPVGNREMENARIFPFKVHRGKTLYDKISNNMVVPKLFGKKGTDAYWRRYDWNKSITAGMDYMGLPFSGEYGFLDSVYAFPISHMVAPKTDSVPCIECHARKGRLDNLTGFYMPGRDRVTALDMGGWTLVVASIIGVVIHALARIFSLRFRNKED